VIAALAGVPERGALLGVAVNLTNETVDVDRQAPVARTGPRLPRPRQALREHAIELADMTERKRPQKRAQCRRGGDPAAQQPAGAPGPQHVAVIDAVGPEHHRVDQHHHLAPRPGRRATHTQPHAIVDETLDPKPDGERRHEHDPGVRDDPVIVEGDLNSIQSDRPAIINHQGDLLTPGPGCRHSLKKPCSGGHSCLTTGQNQPTHAV